MITPVWFEMLGVGSVESEDIAIGGGELRPFEPSVGRPVKQRK